MAEEIAAQIATPEMAGSESERARRALALGRAAEAFLIPAGALIVSLILFGALALASGFPQFSLSVVGVRLWVDAGLLAIVAAKKDGEKRKG